MMGCSQVRSVSFAEIEGRLQSLNPALVDALTKIVGDGALKKRGNNLPQLHLASYPYGAAIVNRGTFETPCADPACATCSALRADCWYSHIPLAVVLGRSVEVFLDAPTSMDAAGDAAGAVPLRVLSEGDLFGVFETLHSLLGEGEARPPWSVSSGSRSIWIIAPLGDRRITEALTARCGCHVDWSRTESHWRLVQQAMAPTEKWRSEVLFFGRGFFDRVQAHASGTDKLFELILATGWRQSAALRHASTVESTLRQRYLDPTSGARAVACELGDMYLFATVSHLFAISRGDAPAFEPAGQARCAYGPFAAFERELHEVLKIIKGEQASQVSAHYPVIMQPVQLNEAGQRGFYSFRCPSLPGLRLPRVTSYAELPTPIKKAVEALTPDGNHAIDLRLTTYFARAGRFDLKRPESGFRWEDLLAHVGQTKELFKSERLFLDSPFLVSGIRVIRGELSRTRAR